MLARSPDQVLVSVTGGYLLRSEPRQLDAAVPEPGHDAARARGPARGGPVAGHGAGVVAGSSAYREIPGPWAQTERIRLVEMRLTAVEQRADVMLAAGQHAVLVSELAALVREHPLREPFAAQLMTALYRSGRQAEALAVYLKTRRTLAEELAVEPGPQLQQLHEQILRADRGLMSPETSAQEARHADGTEAAVAAVREVPAVPQVRYSLPADSAAFIGRDRELSLLTAAVASAAGGGGVVTVVAIDGMPGVGKTTLAVHAAHVLADRFPDRQLFIDLHAHTPGREPVQPEDALAGLLAAAGVDSRYLPADLDGRAAMWRDAMAGQDALLVLDNAASTSQVAPLLPGADGCLVLVTSRRHLGDLPGSVTPVLLDVLAPEKAQEMFIRLVPRATTDLEGVAEAVGLAGCLPLAVSLLARVMARHRSWTVAGLAAETREHLLTLTPEYDSVAAAFEVSYRHLDPSAQQFFTMLGLHPGTTTDAYAAATLTGTTLTEATRLLDQLHGEGLLTETGHRRYGMHDLLRRYARDHAATFPAGTSELAVERLLAYYQHTASRADAWLARQTRPGPRQTYRQQDRLRSRTLTTPGRRWRGPVVSEPACLPALTT